MLKSVLFLVMFATPLLAAAQSRLPPIPADKLTDAQKQAIAQFKVERGVDISGPFYALLRSPETMVRTAALGTYLRYKTELGSQLNEFVILLTSRHWSQSYEWSVHQPIALKAGLSPDVTKAIAEGRRPSAMSPDQEIAYDFCTELLTNRAVSDPTYARAVSRFGEKGTIEMVSVVGYYSMIGLVLNVARTPPDTQGLPTLAPLIR